jgi:hypothetical protein
VEPKQAGIKLNATDRKCDSQSKIGWHRKPARSLTRCRRHHQFVVLVEFGIRCNQLCSIFTRVNARLTRWWDVFVLLQAAACDLAAASLHSGPR